MPSPRTCNDYSVSQCRFACVPNVLLLVGAGHAAGRLAAAMQPHMTTLQPPGGPAHAAVLPDNPLPLAIFPRALPLTRVMDLRCLKRQPAAAANSEEAAPSSKAGSAQHGCQHQTERQHLQHGDNDGQGRSGNPQRRSMRGAGNADESSISRQDVLDLTAALREHAASVTDSTDVLKAVLQQLRSSHGGVDSGIK